MQLLPLVPTVAAAAASDCAKDERGGRERERERGKRNNGDIIAFDGKKGRNESERERTNGG